MKRILLGIMTLLTGGMGSAGVFYGHHLLTQQGEQQTAEPEVADVAPRDLTPTPIPIAPSEVEQPRGGDPFTAGSRDDREPARDPEPAASRYAAETTAAADGDIPD